VFCVVRFKGCAILQYRRERYSYGWYVILLEDLAISEAPVFIKSSANLVFPDNHNSTVQTKSAALGLKLNSFY
jgi:hypothetical protein